MAGKAMNLQEWFASVTRSSQLPGESDGEWTHRINREGSSKGKFRQCSIGYHDECSDPDGEECKCGCHSDSAPSWDTLVNWCDHMMRERDGLERIIYLQYSGGDIPAELAERYMEALNEGEQLNG